MKLIVVSIACFALSAMVASAESARSDLDPADLEPDAACISALVKSITSNPWWVNDHREMGCTNAHKKAAMAMVDQYKRDKSNASKQDLLEDTGDSLDRWAAGRSGRMAKFIGDIVGESPDRVPVNAHEQATSESDDAIKVDPAAPERRA